jgi:hypothetical protein
MKLQNHQPILKMFGNGFQITFPNKYSVVVKIGINTKSTQVQKIEDAADYLMAARYGGMYGPDCEVEVYDPVNKNITDKFGSETSLGFVTMQNLAVLMYTVSSLRK